MLFLCCLAWARCFNGFLILIISPSFFYDFLRHCPTFWWQILMLKFAQFSTIDLNVFFPRSPTQKLLVSFFLLRSFHAWTILFYWWVCVSFWVWCLSFFLFYQHMNLWDRNHCRTHLCLNYWPNNLTRHLRPQGHLILLQSIPDTDSKTYRSSLCLSSTPSSASPASP